MKRLTETEFIRYRNKVIHRAKARRRVFPNDPPSYWEIRLQELNDRFPQYIGIGQIEIKKK